MNNTVGSYEAKTHLPALLKRVEAGETLIITRHGHPIARLSPVVETPRLSPAEAVECLRLLRRGKTLGRDLSSRDVSAHDLLSAGHR